MTDKQHNPRPMTPNTLPLSSGESALARYMSIRGNGVVFANPSDTMPTPTRKSTARKPRVSLDDASAGATSLMSLPMVLARLQLGRSHVYAWIKQGLFPAPIKVGHASRWVRHEVDAWIEARLSERGQATGTGTQS